MMLIKLTKCLFNFTVADGDVSEDLKRFSRDSEGISIN